MTAIVGVLCRDGLVIGTDSSTTFSTGMGPNTIEQPTEKLQIFYDSVIVAGTGQVGLGQRFGRVVNSAYEQKVFRGDLHYTIIGTALCTETLKDFSSTGMKPGQYGALVGFSHGNKVCMCEFAIVDFQPEFKTEKLWYCSMGSGQLITDPFLGFMREVFWAKGQPTVQDATFAVTWTLDHAVQVNPGGINGPVRIAVMEKRSSRYEARILQDADLEEHRQNIQQAKDRLRSFPSTQNAAAPGTPEIPEPPK
jgi:20S proteasome alpha/beta subunit